MRVCVCVFAYERLLRAALLMSIIPERQSNETKNTLRSKHEKKAAMRGCESGNRRNKIWHSFDFYGIPLFRSQRTRRRCASIASYSVFITHIVSYSISIIHSFAVRIYTSAGACVDRQI